MKDLKLEIKKIRDNAIIPKYATEQSAGFDLYSCEQIELPVNTPIIAHTGLKMKIPENFELQIRPRSGLALKYGLTVLNTPGTIDADYRGEICIILIWTGYYPEDNKDQSIIKDNDKNILLINSNTRIAQCVIAPVYQANFELVDEIDNDTERGENGFGSSGLK